MITGIKISNSSGILDEVYLDLKKGKYDYRNEFIYKDKVVSPAVLYGHNGSGKTSILKSINNIIQIFSGDLQSGEYYAMPHQFTDDNVTKIQLEFILNNKEYTYIVEIEDRNVLVLERLIRNKEWIVSRERTDFLLLNYEEYITDNNLHAKLADNMSIVRYIGLNGLNEEIADIYNYFKSFRFVATNKAISSIGESESLGRKLSKFNEQYNSFIQDYNSIMNLQFKVEKGPREERIIAIYNKEEAMYELDYETQISSGTRDLYEMLATLLDLEPGSLIVIDELEKTLHPELLDVLIRDIVSKLDVQIISSSHNTHLLQSLRPDQVYFVNKENDMAKLSRLSTEHSGIREIHNIEKLYLGGRIG